jgi:hypothetical protein
LNFLSFSSFEIWKWCGAKGCECELFFSKKLLWEQDFILGFEGVPSPFCKSLKTSWREITAT